MSLSLKKFLIFFSIFGLWFHLSHSTSLKGPSDNYISVDRGSYTLSSERQHNWLLQAERRPGMATETPPHVRETWWGLWLVQSSCPIKGRHFWLVGCFNLFNAHFWMVDYYIYWLIVKSICGYKFCLTMLCKSLFFSLFIYSWEKYT